VIGEELGPSVLGEPLVRGEVDVGQAAQPRPVEGPWPQLGDARRRPCLAEPAGEPAPGLAGLQRGRDPRQRGVGPEGEAAPDPEEVRRGEVLGGLDGRLLREQVPPGRGDEVAGHPVPGLVPAGFGQAGDSRRELLGRPAREGHETQDVVVQPGRREERHRNDETGADSVVRDGAPGVVDEAVRVEEPERLREARDGSGEPEGRSLRFRLDARRVERRRDRDARSPQPGVRVPLHEEGVRERKVFRLEDARRVDVDGERFEGPFG